MKEPCKTQIKILIATGGTGGHIFPSQSLAIELLQKNYDLLFVGGGLKTNRYFNRRRFSYRQIDSASPYKGNIFKSLYRVVKGIWQAWKIMREYKPSVVIGFGSFYTFPVLVSARLRKIPIVIFEPNAFPGRVNRLFSKTALFSAVQFAEAKSQLLGNIIEVKMPIGEKKQSDSKEAREYFYLDPNNFTFLVFGGSQGSESINSFFSETIGKILSSNAFQVIHITGKAETADVIRATYEKLQIRACVKAFEEKMDLAWSAANVVICRSGAATIAEQISFEVPGILVPYPKAVDDHQTKNALFIEKIVGGAITCLESKLSVEHLKKLIEHVMVPKQLQKMKKALSSFKEGKEEFSKVISELVESQSG